MKIGCVTCGARLQALCGPLNRLDELRALTAQQSAQAQLREVGRSRHADLRVGGDQILLRRPNIGAAFEQRGGQSRGGTSGGNSCSVRLCPRGTVPGFSPSKR